MPAAVPAGTGLRADQAPRYGVQRGSRGAEGSALGEIGGDAYVTATAAVALLLVLGACATAPEPCPPQCAGADLRGATLRGSDLREADLSGADLTAADLRGAILTGADLRNARLYRSTLAGAVLIAVDLTGSDLTEADMTGAVLTHADLTGSFLIDVQGCDLTGRLPGCTPPSVSPPPSAARLPDVKIERPAS